MARKKGGKSRNSRSDGLNWAVVIFLFVRLFSGLVIFFSAPLMGFQSPYMEIVAILGSITTLTSGIKVTFRNWFEDWEW